METGGESARGLHAVRVLQNKKDFTLDGLRAAAFDSYLTWFEKPMPALIKAWDDAPATDPLKAKVAEQIALLRDWDLRWSATSVPTSLADLLGRRRCSARGGADAGRGDRMQRQRAGTAAAGARRGVGPTDRRFRHLEDALGRDQPLPAHQRRHRRHRSPTPGRAFR